MSIVVTTWPPPDARALLRAAVAELDAIVAEGLAPETADRLNGVSALIKEVVSVLEEPRP